MEEQGEVGLLELCEPAEDPVVPKSCESSSEPHRFIFGSDIPGRLYSGQKKRSGLL